MAKKKVYARSIYQRPYIGMTASVVQKTDQVFHTFVSDEPAIILVRRGIKTVTLRNKSFTLRAGDALALAAGTTCDVENRTERGLFESTWIVCAPELISNVEKTSTGKSKIKDLVTMKKLGPEFLQSFDRAVQAISDPLGFPDPIAIHRVQEVLLWLGQTGSAFAGDTPTDLHRQLRLKLGASPNKKWTAKDLAKAFAMSEATFRRKLAETGHSFNEVLIDIRMTTALTLLQVTDSSISEIGFKVGYESASRFTARFRKRFGFAPSEIREQQKRANG
jgi:AraC-like DNA-binding protein